MRASTAVFATAVVACLLLSAVPAAADLPAGFVTYFRSDSCPWGWAPLPEAAGRLLVSVTDPSQSGLTVGTPLADKEDRTHTHEFTAQTSLPTKHVAALHCCNDQAAAEGTFNGNGTANEAASGLPFTQIVLCRLNAASETLQLPFGSIGFFDSTVPTCPFPWTTFDPAVGRTIIPGYKAVQGFTRSESAPLQSTQKVMHKHQFTTTVQTDSVTFAGVDGCCNDDTAASGKYSAEGDLEEADSNLPYLQMLTCLSQDETFNVSLPSDAMFFNPAIGCPKGWQLASELSGRMLVPVPQGGEVGASFGGTSIGQTQTVEPTHSHGVAGSINAAATGVGLATGCCADGYAKAGPIPFTATTSTDVVAFPWLMVTMCELA